MVTNEETIAESPELVAGMVRAITRGIVDTIADPETAFDVSVAQIPDITEDQYDTQYQILLNSIELWRSDTPGETTLEAWELTQDVLISTELLEEPIDDLEAAFSNEFIPDIEMDTDMEGDGDMEGNMDGDVEGDMEATEEPEG